MNTGVASGEAEGKSEDESGNGCRDHDEEGHLRVPIESNSASKEFLQENERRDRPKVADGLLVFSLVIEDLSHTLSISEE